MFIFDIIMNSKEIKAKTFYQKYLKEKDKLFVKNFLDSISNYMIKKSSKMSVLAVDKVISSQEKKYQDISLLVVGDDFESSVSVCDYLKDFAIEKCDVGNISHVHNILMFNYNNLIVRSDDAILKERLNELRRSKLPYSILCKNNEVLI